MYLRQVMQGIRRNLLGGLLRAPSNTSDLDDTAKGILEKVSPYTMTSVERLIGLIEAVRYLCRNGIAGDIAECGVWRGGSMMAVALTLLSEGDDTRKLHLFDTFEGMSEPTEKDRDPRGRSARELLRAERRSSGVGVWCYARIEDVQANLGSTGYPRDRIEFIKGKVEETIPAALPGPLALLRLDTDWYESTKHELEHLYPLLVSNGVLIVDDYGHWQGSRQATDEFFQQRGRRPFLHRLDYTGRLIVKTDLA